MQKISTRILLLKRQYKNLEHEILNVDPTGPASQLQLTLAIAQLNSRIRGRGLSAKEMWTQWDQFTNAQLPVSDRQLITEQYAQRMSNHPHSEHSKAPTGKPRKDVQLEVGDLLYTDRDKSRGRDRYLGVSIEGIC